MPSVRGRQAGTAQKGYYDYERGHVRVCLLGNLFCVSQCAVQPALRHSVRVWFVVFARLGRLFRNKSSVALDDACEAGTTPSLTAEKQFFCSL
jgi:hypothetical protein